MSDTPFWEADPDSWDTVVLGPFEFPGICEFVVDEIPEEIEIKKPNGGGGARITDRGGGPAKCTITVRAYTADEWAVLASYGPKLRPLPGKGTTPPYDVHHPLAAFWNIAALKVLSVSGPKLVNGVGVLTLRCIEFLKPNGNATTTPTQAIPAFDNALTAPAKMPTPPSAAIPKP